MFHHCLTPLHCVFIYSYLKENLERILKIANQVSQVRSNHFEDGIKMKIRNSFHINLMVAWERPRQHLDAKYS